jgi:hypothetical protein
MYLAGKTRFDILSLTHRLCTVMEEPHVAHENALELLVKYLKDTVDMELILEPNGLDITVMSDASYACHFDGKSQTGGIVFVGGSSVWAKSSKQSLVTKSSAEAELVALNSVVEEVVYIRSLAEELGCEFDKPSQVFVDNTAAISMAKKGELGTRRTKHFVVRHYWIWEQLEAGNVSVQHLSNDSMVADGLTKILPRAGQAAFGRLILAGSSAPRGGVSRVVTWKPHKRAKGSSVQ